MLHIRYFIILDGQNIKKKSVLESSIFELPRLVPLTPWEPPPPPTHTPK